MMDVDLDILLPSFSTISKTGVLTSIYRFQASIFESTILPKGLGNAILPWITFLTISLFIDIRTHEEIICNKQSAVGKLKNKIMAELPTEGRMGRKI
jgi:hypothetical protein